MMIMIKISSDIKLRTLLVFTCPCVVSRNQPPNLLLFFLVICVEQPLSQAKKYSEPISVMATFLIDSSILVNIISS